MSILYYFLGQSNVLLVRQRRCVDHHARESEVNAALAKLEAVTVIQVQTDLRMLPAKLLGIFYSTLCHVTQQRLVGVVASAFRNLQNNRALCLSRSLDDCLKLLHVVEVECRDSIAPLDCLGEHLTRVHKA